MVELRPMPKLLEENVPDNDKDQINAGGADQITNTDVNKTPEIEAIEASREKEEHVSQGEQNAIDLETNSQGEKNTVTLETNSHNGQITGSMETSSDLHDSTEVHVSTNTGSSATISSDPPMSAPAQPELLKLDALSRSNAVTESQPIRTIASVTGPEKEPIDCPRPSEAGKPHGTQGINSATVTDLHVPLSHPHNSPQTKSQQLPRQMLKTKPQSDKSVHPNFKDAQAVPKISCCSTNNTPRDVRPHSTGLDLHTNRSGHPVLQPAARYRPSTRDKCRSGQRALTNTGRSSGGNHYQNSAKPVSAGAALKCFPLNNVATTDGAHWNMPIPNYEKPYCKRELRRALPRKSNFSCHSAAMKEAGFEDESIAQRKAERLKERLARVANSFNPLLGMSSYVATGHVPATVEVVVTDANGHGQNDGRDIDAVAAGNLPAIQLTSGAQDLHSGDSVTLEVKDNGDSFQHLLAGSGIGGLAGGMETAGGPRRRRPASARVEYIDCKPLSQYLEYVRDNRQEYLNYVRQQQQQQQAARKDKPVASLIKMGQAFELRHQGGTTRGRKTTAPVSADSPDGPSIDGADSNTDLIVMAAKALRPRSGNPGKYAKSRDKSGSVGRRGGDPAARPLSDDRKSAHAEKAAHGPSTAGGAGGSKEEEHGRTELEKRKLRAEDWTRSVPTHTLTRARIQSLRELGADDAELTRWWEALKGCHYLRKNVCQL
ncbi:hypothetical protein EGW08_007488 [Elysia chlorotica]|uniref:Uncharacterized protein n=1 Tax=Elysia chlorotica TaxID=188477 RepID=A0A3S1BN87_ELYCH|nr:hypothetical protein EGW08_007488 [Elysia chlorotica]